MEGQSERRKEERKLSSLASNCKEEQALIWRKEREGIGRGGGRKALAGDEGRITGVFGLRTETD